MQSSIHIFTFKAGLLARVAHDLRLRVGKHAFTLEAGKVRGHCDSDSLEVEGVMTSRGLDSSVLSAGDKRQITETIRSEILQSARYPRVELEAEVSSVDSSTFDVRGVLHVRGHAQPLHVQLTQHADVLSGAFELTPSQFGIAPYKALVGAIKLQDRVRVRVEITLTGQDAARLLASPDTLQL